MTTNQLDYTKLPENVTGEAIYDAFFDNERLMHDNLDSLAKAITADRADRAKNTVRIPDESEWVDDRDPYGPPKGLAVYCFPTWHNESAQIDEVGRTNDGTKMRLLAYIPRSTPKTTPDQLRAKLHAIFESIPDDELAVKVPQIEEVVR